MDAKLRLCLLVIFLGSLALLQGTHIRNQDPKEKSVKAKNESLLVDDREDTCTGFVGNYLAYCWRFPCLPGHIGCPGRIRLCPDRRDECCCKLRSGTGSDARNMSLYPTK